MAAWSHGSLAEHKLTGKGCASAVGPPASCFCTNLWACALEAKGVELQQGGRLASAVSAAAAASTSLCSLSLPLLQDPAHWSLCTGLAQTSQQAARGNLWPPHFWESRSLPQAAVLQLLRQKLSEDCNSHTSLFLLGGILL